MPAPSSSIVPGFCGRDNGHKVKAKIAETCGLWRTKSLSFLFCWRSFRLYFHESFEPILPISSKAQMCVRSSIHYVRCLHLFETRYKSWCHPRTTRTKLILVKACLHRHWSSSNQPVAHLLRREMDQWALPRACFEGADGEPS